jgi:hypothetical protein
LSFYPENIANKKAHWYFVASLSDNLIADRLLAIILGESSYSFLTESSEQKFIKGIKFTDIEGEWNYVYFSYSNEKQKAVGFFKG